MFFVLKLQNVMHICTRAGRNNRCKVGVFYAWNIFTGAGRSGKKNPSKTSKTSIHGDFVGKSGIKREQNITRFNGIETGSCESRTETSILLPLNADT